MKKKKAILIGIIVLSGTLFINLVISGHSGETDITFNNIEALAQEESGDVNPNPQCIESGFICVGTDKNNNLGRHPGLMQNTKK